MKRQETEEEPSYQPGKRLEVMVLTVQHPMLSPLSWVENEQETQAQDHSHGLSVVTAASSV